MNFFYKGKGIRQDKYFLNFRLDICITNLNQMEDFFRTTKHMKDRENKIPVHPVRQNPNKWQLTVC